MKRLLHVFKLLACLLLYQSGMAQETVTGRVADSTGAGLPGVNVVQRSTANGVITDSSGSFQLVLQAGAPKLLDISSVGFATLSVPYTGTVLDMVLRRAGGALDEVVVVGYSTQRRTAITGAVTSVNIGDLEERRVPNVAQALQGQVAGVNITQSTGAPGDPISIRIRGEGTIGNNSPLFIIDGVPSRDISFLAPSDIQSMTVLKDASAASIYGSRASAGVIVITTKSGRRGRTSLDIDYFSGVQKVANLPKLLNGQQYMDKMEEAWNNSERTGTNPYTADKTARNLANTDWLNELFELGHSQNLQLTASGGTDKVQFLLSAGAYQQNGIVVYDNDRFKRLNLRANINANLTGRLSIGTNLQLSYVSQDALSSRGDAPGIIRHALIRPPVLPVYKDPSDPTYSVEDPFTDLPFYTTPWDNNANSYEFSSNPVALAYFTNDKRNSFKTFGNVYAEYAFLQNKELRFRSNVGVDLNFTHNKAFRQNFGDDNGSGSGLDRGNGRQNNPTNLDENRGEEVTITWNNTLNYSRTFDRHSVSGLVGSEFIKNRASSIGASRQRFDFIDPQFQYIDYGGIANLYNGGSGGEWSLLSFFGSATYMYNSKYILTGNLRADASSRFGENNKWGYFPSVSAGWRISTEDFMQNISWLSDLKLRASVGRLGNQEIGNYSYATIMRREGDRFVVDRYGNPDVKWETTTQRNIGFDMALLKSRISLSVDYFDKNTSGILLPLGLPITVGNANPSFVNAAEVNNKGIEIALGVRSGGGSFSYSVNANLATVTNRVEALHPKLPNITGDVYRTEPGRPLSSFYGYVMEGIYQTQDEIISHLKGTTNPSAKPGDIRYKDINGDGIINDNDRDYLGSSIPKLSYGLNASAGYKGFDLSVLFQGVGGANIYNDGRQITDYDSRPFNHSVETLDSWKGPGTSNTIPRSTFQDNGSSRKSSIFVEDASYLRLKNLELGYTLPRFAGIQNIRVYVSAQNLITITNYTGLDPESTDLLDRGTYPQSIAVLFGLNVKF